MKLYCNEETVIIFKIVHGKRYQRQIKRNTNTPTILLVFSLSLSPFPFRLSIISFFSLLFENAHVIYYCLFFFRLLSNISLNSSLQNNFNYFCHANVITESLPLQKLQSIDTDFFFLVVVMMALFNSWNSIPFYHWIVSKSF